MYLHRLALGVFLEVLTGRENFDVLQEGLGHHARARRATRGVARNEHIHAHARHDEAGHAHHVVHFNRYGSHARWDGGRQACTRTLGSKTVFDNRLPVIDRGHHATPHDILLAQ